MLVETSDGLFCPAGDFFIDPWNPGRRAVITHAHGDHARHGSASYLCATPGAGLLRRRLGPDAHIESVAYGQRLRLGDVTVSFHPAGHVLGSAQIRVEGEDGVWVAAGDYKRAADPTCAPFEPVPCDTFVTESTFGLPIYRWPPQPALFADINAWWAANAAAGKASVLYAYAFGKAQRLLHGVDAGIGPIVVHGAVEPLNAVYRAAGVALPTTHRVTDPQITKADLRRALVIAPPSAAGTPWLKRFSEHSDAFASGWMLVRGARRRRRDPGCRPPGPSGGHSAAPGEG